MPILRILLLGTPEVSWDGKAIKIQRKMARALLFFLACHPKPVTRDAVIAALWDDVEDDVKNEDERRKRLRDILGRLRMDLPEPGLVIAEQNWLQLDPRRVEVDVLQFLDLVKQTERPLQLVNRGRVPPSLLEMENRAVALWRGRQLLPSDLPESAPLEAWRQNLEAELQQDLQNMLVRLAEHSAANGDYPAAIRWVRQALQDDPLQDRLHSNILDWQIKLGQLSEAIAYGSFVEKIYRTEGGMELPPQLKQTIQKARSTALVTDLPGLSWTPSFNPSLPYVAQDDTLAELRAAFRRGGAMALLGETGSGKTRLVYELYRSAKPTPYLFLASGRPHETGLLLQPVFTTLRRIVRKEDWDKLSLEWVTQLVRYLPELNTLRPDVHSAPDNSSIAIQTQDILFEAIRQILIIICRGRQMLFFLDDLQWCDESTLLLVSYLLERGFFEKYGLLILAVCTENPPIFVSSFLSSTAGSGTILQINLPMLRSEKTEALVQSILGQSPSAKFVEQLLQDTGGNPLFIIETLHTLVELNPSLNIHTEIQNLPLSSGFHAVMRDRMRLLSPIARQVISAAAVIGKDFPPDLLEAVTQLNNEQVTSALEELERLNIIRAVSPGMLDFSFGFVQAKFREVLLLETSQIRLRTLHRRVAEALEKDEKRRDPAMSLVLAQHYEQAGLLPLALEKWVLAGEYAYAQLARAQMLNAYEHAEQLLLREGSRVPDALVYRLYASWSQAVFNQGDNDLLHRIYSTMQQIGENRRNPLLMGAALSGLGYTLFQKRKASEALRCLDLSWRYLTPTENIYELAEMHNRTGMVLTQTDHLPQAKEHFEQAFELLRDQINPQLTSARTNCFHRLAAVYMLMGWPERAIALARQALTESLNTMDPGGAGYIHLVLASSNYWMGECLSGLDRVRQGLLISEAIQNWRLSAYLRLSAARLEMYQGHFDQSWQHIQIVLEAPQRYPFADIVSSIYTARGDLFRMLGNRNKARENFQTGSQGHMLAYTRLNNLYCLGGSECYDEEWQSGLTHINQAISEAEELQMGIVRLPAQMIKVSVLLSHGDFEQASAILTPLMVEIKQSRIILLSLMGFSLQSMLALIDKNIPQALLYAEEVIKISRLHQNTYMEIMGVQLQIRVARQAGLPTDQLALRMDELLAELQPNCQSPAIRPEFERFKQQMLNGSM